MTRRASTWCLAACAVALGCSRAPARGAEARPAPPPWSAVVETPARWVPDTPPSGGAAPAEPDGSRRFVAAGVRMLQRPDGSVARADVLLPPGAFRWIDLPARLGGGVLLASSGGGTRLWKADGWLGRPVPFGKLDTSLAGSGDPLLAGFDRVYVRGDRETIALDPASGREVPLGPLPPGGRLGALAFADAWRAVASIDVRGALATFDAGLTWRPLTGVGVVSRVTVDGADFVLEGTEGRFRLGADGELRADPPSPAVAAPAPPQPPAPRALRIAVEDGWPDGAGGAVALRGTTLLRVRLDDGAVTEQRSVDGLDPEARCHAIALGAGAGFVCAVADGTTILSLEAPLAAHLAVHPVARFARPRVVLPSGRGALAVRGPCARDADPDAAPGAVCVRAADGSEREVRRARAGERVVPLADGRVAWLAPPEGSAPARLAVVDGRGETSVDVRLEGDAAALATALWLDGWEERAPGVLGGWVQIGPDLAGVRIDLAGRGELASVRVPAATTVLAGPLALDWGLAARGQESLDGGRTWRPAQIASDPVQRAATDVRACSRVGCAGAAWLRVGWGDPPDAEVAATPSPSRTPVASGGGLSLRCEPTGEATPAPPAGPSASPRPAPSPAPAGAASSTVPRSTKLTPRRPVPGAPSARAASPSRVLPVPALASPSTGAARRTSRWEPFRGVAPPSIKGSDSAFDVDGWGSPALRVYAWGPAGGDWRRSGRWLVRFVDRFAMDGVRSTAASPAPWADEGSAAEGIGLAAGGLVTWSARLDPGGDAALLVGCRGGRCDAWLAVDGEPLVRAQGLEIAGRTDEVSVVRAGGGFWVLAPSRDPGGAHELVLQRVEGGVARPVARYPRLAPAGQPTWMDPVRVVRRAHGGGVGLLTLGAPSPGRAVRDWFVLPLEPGGLGEPVRLAPSDLDGADPRRCSDEDDGWLVETALAIPAALRVVGPDPASLSRPELRVRLDERAVCVEAIAAEAPSALPVRRPPIDAVAVDVARAVPLVATDPASGRRARLRCAR